MKPFTFRMYNMYFGSKHMYEKLTPLYDEIRYAEAQIHDESTTGDFEEINYLKKTFETVMNLTDFQLAKKYREFVLKENDCDNTNHG